jgi:hypothetical protein
LIAVLDVLAKYFTEEAGAASAASVSRIQRCRHEGVRSEHRVLAINNNEFRRVLYSARHCQLVVIALRPNEAIGAEAPTLDQFFRVRGME